MGQLVRSLMVSRRASELFKSLQAVEVSFNPFDVHATTAREFLRRVRTPPVRNANPKLRIDVDVVDHFGKPTVNLVYRDGQRQIIPTAGMKISEIVDEVERVARWKGDAVTNPFGPLRAQRAKQLGLD